MCVKEHQRSREGVQAAWIPAESRGRSGAGKGARGSPGYYYQTEFISRPAKFTWVSWGRERPKFSPLLLAGYRSTAGRWQKKRSNLQSDAID